MKKKILVILGPTATGKTDIALSLAKEFNGEIVSCDSRQVYKGLDLGTGKLPGKEVVVKKGKGFWEMDKIRVWMYDIVSPKAQYTVKDYVEQANLIVEDISQRGALPIIVGGTGFYLKALLEGLPNLMIPIDKNLRKEIEALSLEDLQTKLKSLSIQRWKQLNESDRKNKRRLLRSIELVMMYPYRQTIQNFKFKIQNYDILKLGLIAPREVLNKRIDFRLVSRVKQGLIEEAKKLHHESLSFQRMRELGLEYRSLADLLEGKISKQQFIETLKTKIHQYAKRQVTWFKREKDVHWFDITEDNWNQKVEKLVTSWYHQGNDA